ncbi:hypothetical protein LY78DRAFT_145936 [Colletotrichum sublineola]|nr:hypothetical protein LY78DRAFT_145936 [Colletotrichum sublineola]
MTHVERPAGRWMRPPKSLTRDDDGVCCAGLVEDVVVLENMDKINRIMSLENDAVGYPVHLATSLPWVHMDSDMETRSSTSMCFSACHRNEHRGSRCQGR